MLNNRATDTVAYMPFCSLLAAVLTACGGGSTDAGAAADVTLLSSADTSMATAQAVKPTAAPTSYATLAKEGGNFKVTGTQTVRFGANSSWVQRTVVGSGHCTNTFFGHDPAYGKVKSCQLVMSGSGVLAGLVTTSAPAPAFAPGTTLVTAWVRLALETSSFALTGSQNVRFGDGAHWVTKTVSSGGTCSVAYFGSDPAFGVSKFCEVQVTVPAVTQIAGEMPVVNKALIPTPESSTAGPRVRQLNPVELAMGNFQPSPTTVGAFREPCTFSHMAFDDPIVFPGQPGASHLHTFVGNTDAGAASTPDSIANSGNSTCAGGTLNRTAYWMPALIDTRTGQPLVPVNTNFYYKLGYLSVKAGTVQPFPKGLRMIAGNSKGKTPVTDPHVGMECMSGGGHQPSIPSCAVGDSLNISVIFPQCWDGVNLDSPDHHSHMAYATAGIGCPVDHPVALPEIALNVHYAVGEPNMGAFLKLSSDMYAGPGGYSLHADWFLGWDPATNQAFVNNCINGNLDCHDQLLGDGRFLY